MFVRAPIREVVPGITEQIVDTSPVYAPLPPGQVRPVAPPDFPFDEFPIPARPSLLRRIARKLGARRRHREIPVGWAWVLARGESDDVLYE